MMLAYPRCPLFALLTLAWAGCGDSSSAESTSDPAPSDTIGTSAGDPPQPTTTNHDESTGGSASASDTATGSTSATTDPGAPDTTTTTTGSTTTTVSTSADASTSTASSSPETTSDETTGAPEIDCSDGVAWARTLLTVVGSQALDDLVVDAQDNVIAVGRVWDQVDLGGGPIAALGQDGLVVKYGPEGQLLWGRLFGDAFEQRVTGIALDPDGHILVTGRFRGSIDFGGGPLVSAGYDDVFLAKLTADGDHVWSRRFGGPDIDYGVHLASDSDGNVVLLAQADGAVDFGGGPLGAKFATHVAKFSAAGAHLWHRAFSADIVYARDVAVDPLDDIVVVGEFDDPVDFGGGLTPSDDGNNVYIVKLDPTGQFLWLRQNGGSPMGGKPFVTGVDIDDAGDLHLAGWFFGTFDLVGPPLVSNGKYDAWIAALGPDGEHLWSSAHGSGPESWQFVSDIASDAAGRTAVAGNFAGTIAFAGDVLVTDIDAYDAFLARLDPDGVPDLVRGFGGPGSQYGDVVAIGADGSTWLGGIFNQPFAAGDDLLVPLDEWSPYIMRLCP